jgi:hypothetical protein
MGKLSRATIYSLRSCSGFMVFMNATYGFQSTMTAKPGMGDQLAGPAAQAIVAQFADLLAEEATYTDYTPVNGKANF